jgi:hypothetical protein
MAKVPTKALSDFARGPVFGRPSKIGTVLVEDCSGVQKVLSCLKCEFHSHLARELRSAQDVEMSWILDMRVDRRKI